MPSAWPPGSCGSRTPPRTGAPSGVDTASAGGVPSTSLLGGWGVDVWRIQALARHSSSAILGYIENLHAQQLGNLAAEATLGRDICDIQEQVRGLRASLTALRGEASQPPPPVPVPPPPAPPPPPPDTPPRSALPFVLSTRMGGRVHSRSEAQADRTRCGWAWTRHEHAVLAADADSGLRCLRCARAAVCSLPSGSSDCSTSSG
jgi:hypothetical protein